MTAKKPVRKLPVKKPTQAPPRAVNPHRIGALWLRESQQGMKYFGGRVRLKDAEINVVVFKNGFKEREDQPDYIIYVSEAASSKKPKPSDDDEVPF